MKHIEVGDIVKYGTYNGATRLVKVTGIEKAGKNGKDVFDGILIKKGGDNSDSSPIGQSVWGYIAQVTQVMKGTGKTIGNFKGDADKKWQAISDAFTRKYKVGDIVFSPLYRHCKIIKMNAKTVGVIQVDEHGNQVVYKNSIFKPKPLVVEKYLFTV